MIRKFSAAVCTVSLLLLPIATMAAHHKAALVHHKAAKARPASIVMQKSSAATGRRIIHTIRANSRYKVQTAQIHKAKFSPSQSVFKDEESSTGELHLASTKALIVNQTTGEVLYAKSTDAATPIASVTKLMTAMVMLDVHPSMDEMIAISEADVDMLKGTGSRLKVGTTLPRREILQLALMSSENRAANSLGRYYPGGLIAFVPAMNAKATQLGMTHSHFVDPTGLNSENVSTAEDLVKMVKAAYSYPEIRQVTTTPNYAVNVEGYRAPVEFRNTNILVRESDWKIGLSKTGFINEAGRCLVMQAEIGGQPLIIVLLDSWGKYTRIGDAQRIRKWIESSNIAMKLAGNA